VCVLAGPGFPGVGWAPAGVVLVGRAGPRGVGVSARCWVLREQAPLFWPSFSRLPCGGWVGVVGWGLLSWAVGVLVGASARVCCGCLAWAWVLCWPWGVCELDSGCEHLDLNDLFCVIGLVGPCCCGGLLVLVWFSVVVSLIRACVFSVG